MTGEVKHYQSTQDQVLKLVLLEHVCVYHVYARVCVCVFMYLMAF